MIFEHFAVNVADAPSVVEWYVSNLGLKARVAEKKPPFVTFLEDSTGRVVIEFYQRADVKAMDYSNVNPLNFHVAFVSEDAEQDKKRLMDMGATFELDVKLDDGSFIVMLRDPWGLPLQLCQRANPF
ncbi:VOC family protein [Muricauda sp. CAU 1633]|uniref:VOC family protein n=1 Tax=Allomuricauda sp. CAU 1633 TaxID=2816036 RepID=UPI001A8CFBFC|nr:VOC family protein [Muricauda sp. CAU 1633]MBO0323833.1 VOC family protein [Muricauda sp. CAU 1633]